jgi:hypothetical protein
MGQDLLDLPVVLGALEIALRRLGYPVDMGAGVGAYLDVISGEASHG